MRIGNGDDSIVKRRLNKRQSMGNILTKYDVQKITLKEKGVSTLGGRKIWFDEDVLRLNADSRGKYLGEFSGGNARSQEGHSC